MTEAKKLTIGQELLALAEQRYRFVQGADGTPYAVENGGNIALSIDGARTGFRSMLAAAFYATTGRVASANALGEACQVLRGWASETERQVIPLRVSRMGNAAIQVDLGGPAKRTAVILRSGPGDSVPWFVTSTSERIFRRTALSAEMPDPDPAGTIDDLRAYLRLANIADADLDVLVGWCAAVVLENLPVPIVMLTAEQGAGKTTTARTLVRLLDPSPVPVRSSPKDLEGWIVAADGSRVVAIDNISTVPDWLSDAWCRAVTGEGLARRQLYTDGELAITQFRRALILTSIDAGALRGDLGERLLTVELDRIPAERRRTEADLEQAITRILPKALGGLFTLTGQVALALTDGVRADPRPRMADFADVLAAVDHLTGTDTLATYAASTQRTMTDLVLGDPLADAIKTVAGDLWFGNATLLLAAIERFRPEDRRTAWPRSARGLSAQLQRLAPSLRASGLDIERDRGPGGDRVITLKRLTV